MGEKKIKKDLKDFSKQEQSNIKHNSESLSGKEIVNLIFSLYKQFLPILLIFVGFILLGAAAFYYLY